MSFNGGAHHFGKGSERHHDVDAYDAARGGAGLVDFAAQGADVGLYGIGSHIGFAHAHHGSGDDAYAAFIGHGGSQAGQRYADTHAALNNGRAGDQIAYFQHGKRHETCTSGLFLEETELFVVKVLVLKERGPL